MNEWIAERIQVALEDIAKEFKESNRLKRLEIRLKYNIPEFDLSAWDLIDEVDQGTDNKEVKENA
jgi:hypothetical protein